MGGLLGADNVCNTLASTAGLSGQFIAWLSTSEQAAADRLEGGGPWRTWSEDVGLWTAPVADNADELRNNGIESPIRFNQLGLSVSTDEKCLVWTGTGGNGKPMPQGGLTNACEDWTAGGFAQIGRCDGTDASWTSFAPAACTKSQRLYCFQAPSD